MSSIGEQNQVARRSMFQSFFYSMTKSFFDEINVTINGNRKGDIKIKDEDVYYRMTKYVTGFDRLALGESYLDGQWETDDLLTFFEKCFQSKLSFNKGFNMIAKVMHSLPLLTLNMQTKGLCRKDISSHYDIGNDLFRLMLDRSMNYSCGYWEKNVFLDPNDGNNNSDSEFKVNTNTLCSSLDEAQMNKMLLIGRKLNLKPNMRVLDIGCGWGYLAKFLAVNFDVHVIGVTISKEQYEFATTTDLKKEDLEFLKIPGLNPIGTGRFEFRLKDYRDVNETFDRIVSVGMIEHVGRANYSEYFDIARRCLSDDGLFLLHTIGIAQDYIPQVEPWLNKYIFPNGMIPYHTQLINASYGKFVIEDWHNFGYSYYRTLVQWDKNFRKSWPLLAAKYGERFFKIWTYYLLFSAALFKTRKLALWQIVLSKDGFPNGYVSYR